MTRILSDIDIAHGTCKYTRVKGLFAQQKYPVEYPDFDLYDDQ